MTASRLGHVKGQPVRFIKGHHARTRVGWHHTAETRARMSGENHPLWKGDEASYKSLHHWVNRHKVREGKCSHCGTEGKTDFANVSGTYKRDVEDFIELCRLCHKVFDGKEIVASRSTKGGGGFQIRRVRTKEDRRRPSVFMRLKADESFRGVALFEPDPELDSNPGYFEYYDHFDKQGNAYVPCAGEKCPFCAANDNPSTRALTAWYFPDNDANEQIKLFTMNYSTINEITDEAEEEDGLIGKKVRIKRLDDRGNYKVRVLP